MTSESDVFDLLGLADPRAPGPRASRPMVRARRWCAAVRERRAIRRGARRDLHERIHRARLEAFGATEGDLRVAMLAAFDAWRARLPWRWIPGRAAPAAFAVLGRGFAGRFVTTWFSEAARTGEGADDGQ